MLTIRIITCMHVHYMYILYMHFQMQISTVLYLYIFGCCVRKLGVPYEKLTTKLSYQVYVSQGGNLATQMLIYTTRMTERWPK